MKRSTHKEQQHHRHHFLHCIYCLTSGTFLPYFFAFFLFNFLSSSWIWRACSLFICFVCKIWRTEILCSVLWSTCTYTSLLLCILHTTHTHTHTLEFEIENDSNSSDQIEYEMEAQCHYITIECDGVSSHLLHAYMLHKIIIIWISHGTARQIK